MQTFDATDLKYVYSPWHSPIGVVSPGEVFQVETSDCFTGRYADPADFSTETAAWVEDNLNPVTGPISVVGATVGGAVEITIHDIAVTTPGMLAVSRCAALSPVDWWHEEDHAVSLPILDGRIQLRDGWSVPIRPLIGCLATAPGRETILSRREGDYGGNMDCNSLTTGATLILPVEAAGGLIYFGDCKAAMGDGEIVAAPEVGTRIVASAMPVPRPVSMVSPRIRTIDEAITVVSGVSVSDASRDAFRALKLWLEDEWQLSPHDATLIMGIGAHCSVCQVSNALHTASCRISLAQLP